MSARRARRWRLAAAVVGVAGALAGSVASFALHQPFTGIAVGVGCLLIARYLHGSASVPQGGPECGEQGEAGR